MRQLGGCPQAGSGSAAFRHCGVRGGVGWRAERKGRVQKSGALAQREAGQGR